MALPYKGLVKKDLQTPNLVSGAAHRSDLGVKTPLRLRSQSLRRSWSRSRLGCVSYLRTPLSAVVGFTSDSLSEKGRLARSCGCGKSETMKPRESSFSCSLAAIDLLFFLPSLALSSSQDMFSAVPRAGSGASQVRRTRPPDSPTDRWIRVGKLEVMVSGTPWWRASIIDACLWLQHPFPR